MKRSLAAVTTAVLLMVCALGTFYVSAQQARASRLAQPAVTPLPPAPTLREAGSVVAEAEVLPITSAELSLAANGVVSEVLVSRGELVSKNQVLLRLDTSLEAARLKIAQAALDRAKAGHASALVTLTTAQTTRNPGTAGPQPEVAVAEANTQATLASVVLAEASLQRALARLNADELRAPFAGTVVSVNIRPGETLTAGALAIRLADLSHWQFVTKDLTELAVPKVAVGSPVEIKFAALPDLQLSGQVVRIDDFGTNRQGDIVYAVVIAPDTVDPRMRWHMTASVSIRTH
jgi:RND family efflux transporter MFP subunit